MSRYRLLQILTAIVMIADTELHAQKVYWTNDSGLNRANVDGTDVAEVLKRRIYEPVGIAIDPLAQTIYWNDDQDGISRQVLGTSCAELLVDEWNGVGIALDVERGWMYWSQGYYSSGNGRVRRARLDGSQLEDLVTDIDAPRGIALDRANGKIYWAEYSGRIRRANLDGTGVETVLSGLATPDGVALDLTSRRIYWTEGADLGTPRIRRATLTGQNVENIPIEGLTRPGGIAVDISSNALVWAERGTQRIRRADLSGANTIDLVASTEGAPWGVAIHESWVYWSTRGGQLNARIRRIPIGGGDPEDVVSTDIAFPFELTIDPAGHRLFWYDDVLSTIFSSDLDGRNIHGVLTDLLWINGMTLDSEDNRIYWIENGVLYRSWMDGTGTETIVDLPDGPTIMSVALHAPAGKVYWAQHDPHAIQRANLDGSDIELLFDAGTAFVEGIAVDTSNSKLYWSQRGTGLRRASLDGSGIEDLVGFADVLTPRHLSLDVSHGKLYWKSGIELQRSNLDGSEIETVRTFSSVQYPLGVAVCPTGHIVYSDSPTGAIDARQPHDINDLMFRYGWSEIELEFSDTLDSEDLLDFEVVESGGDGVPPSIESIAPVADNVVRITLNDVIEPGAWTCFHHINSGTKSCLGYLPGDVDGDGTSSPVDILRLVDSLNGVIEPPYDVWQVDINRSGMADPGDILRLIDLLNGASKFGVWNGRTLHACP